MWILAELGGRWPASLSFSLGLELLIRIRILVETLVNSFAIVCMFNLANIKIYTNDSIHSACSSTPVKYSSQHFSSDLKCNSGESYGSKTIFEEQSLLLSQVG